MKKLLLTLILVLFCANVFAQTAATRTTLTTATTQTAGTQNITVGSTTGINATTTSTQIGNINSTGTQYCLIDAELFIVTAVPSSTVLTIRHTTGVITQHVATSEVRCGAGATFQPSTGNVSGVFLGANASVPVGSCTRANNQFLPVFSLDNPAPGAVTAYDCPNNVSSTTGVWISWLYSPGFSAQMSRTVLPSTATSYTATVGDYYIAVTSAITALNTISITLPCASVPAINTKVWIVGDEGLGPGTGGRGISILGAGLDTQQILVGGTAKAYRSNGTSCFRLF